MSRLRRRFTYLFFLAGSALSACGVVAQPIPLATAPATAEHDSFTTSEAVMSTQESELDYAGSAESSPIPFILPTLIPEPDLTWRPPPYPIPWAIRSEDHFYFARPIPSGDVNWPHPHFRYGNTYFGEQAIHTGVDLGAERGTPVLAAGDGEVVWAGYGLYRGTHDPTDPYGLAVAIRHNFGHEGKTLYTVYAHLEKTFVWEGQRVTMREQIGIVGSTGHSDGPHLHFEIRLGENRYFDTRNPELWMVPPEGWAVLAGRVLNTYGALLPEYLVQIRSLETDQRWNVWTYAQTTIHPDSFYNENFVISDLPAGPYEITIDFIGRSFVANMYLYPGQTNFIIFKGRHGYTIHPTPTPVDLSKPPDL